MYPLSAFVNDLTYTKSCGLSAAYFVFKHMKSIVYFGFTIYMYGTQFTLHVKKKQTIYLGEATKTKSYWLLVQPGVHQLTYHGKSKI